MSTFDYVGMGHFCIIVDDIEQATTYYERILGAKAIQEFPHFKNKGFAKDAGFVENPEEVDVTIRFLELDNIGAALELKEYHVPKGKTSPTYFRQNDVSGIRHICFKVKNIDEIYEFMQKQDDVKFVTESPEYKPCLLDPVTQDQFRFFDERLENSKEEKENVCKIISSIKYFYILDRYGVQWEFEQGHQDIGE